MAEVISAISVTADDGHVLIEGGTTTNILPNLVTIGYRLSYDRIHHVYLRFTNIIIPKDAIITSAILTGCASSTASSGTVAVNIKANLAENPLTITSYEDWEARIKTTASVSWNLGALVQGTYYDSPDIKAVIQELVNQESWVSGNSILIFLENDNSDNYRSFYDRGISTNCTEITINYTSGPASIPRVFLGQLDSAFGINSTKPFTFDSNFGIDKMLYGQFPSSLGLTNELIGQLNNSFGLNKYSLYQLNTLFGLIKQLLGQLNSSLGLINVLDTDFEQSFGINRELLSLLEIIINLAGTEVLYGGFIINIGIDKKINGALDLNFGLNKEILGNLESSIGINSEISNLIELLLGLNNEHLDQFDISLGLDKENLFLLNIIVNLVSSELFGQLNINIGLQKEIIGQVTGSFGLNRAMKYLFNCNIGVEQKITLGSLLIYIWILGIILDFPEIYLKGKIENTKIKGLLVIDTNVKSSISETVIEGLWINNSGIKGIN